jgi:hypothetical protein
MELCSNPKIREAYTTMCDLSRSSAKRYLQGEWEEIIITDPADTRVDVFRDNWKRIWDLWHNEPCNILYLDSDTLFIKPTVMFGRFKEFRLFNNTDPKRNHMFNEYLNAGVRYYPSTMSEEVWQIGAEMAKNWNIGIWDQEQLIFNKMFWSQNVEDWHHPELNWQGMNLRNNDPDSLDYHKAKNKLEIAHAHILHFSGSRGAETTVDIMSAVHDLESDGYFTPKHQVPQ